MPENIMSNHGRSTGMCPSVCVLQCVCPGINICPWEGGGVGVEREKEGGGGWEKE